MNTAYFGDVASCNCSTACLFVGSSTFPPFIYGCGGRKKTLEVLALRVKGTPNLGKEPNLKGSEVVSALYSDGAIVKQVLDLAQAKKGRPLRSP